MKHLPLIAALLILAFFPGCGCNMHQPGTGQKVGQIVKLSHGGVFVDTWEGQILRGGLTDGSGAVGGVPFDFTIEDQKLLPLIESYMSNQTEVIITYRREGIYSVFRSDSGGDFLISIEPVNKSTVKK